MANPPTECPDNYVRVLQALQHVCSKVAPSIDFTIRKWHAKQIFSSNLKPCGKHGKCPNKGKPKKPSFCPNCIQWGSALESAYYPQPTGAGDKPPIVWKNVHPPLLCNSYIEVANGFALILPAGQRPTRMEDYDPASLLKVMWHFGECHQNNTPTQRYPKPVDVISKVVNIRNSLSHSPLHSSIDIDDQTVSDYFTDIKEFVCCLEELGHLTQQDADDTRSWLDKIKSAPISQHLTSEIKQIIEGALQGRDEELQGHLMKTVEDFFKDEEIDAEAIKDQLKSKYRESRGTVNLLPGIPEEYAKMKDIFVELDLIRTQTMHGNIDMSKLKSHNDLFKDYQGNIMKRVLVRGAPGCGKSTLVSKLAYDWAKNDDSLAQFRMVFAIDLKEVIPGTDLMDVIQEQLLPKVSKRGLERYIESNAKDVLFLFDGYDEILRSFLEGSSQGFKGVLSSKLFTESFVILTTRPHKVPAINNLYGHKTHYAQVEINGLPRDSVFKFISKFFRVPLGHIDWVNRYGFIKTLPASDASVTEPPEDQMKEAEIVASLVLKICSSDQVMQVCRYPITLTMLCYVWKEKQDFSLILTNLYHEAIYHVAKNRSRVDDEGDIDIHGVKKRVDDLLVKLGKVALEGLLENRLIFTGNEFDSDILNEACEVGLVSRERKRSILNPVNHVAFLHKTFQEMSAGCYLGYLAESDENLFSSYIPKLSAGEDKELMLRFCCGTNSKAAMLILKAEVRSSSALKHKLENVTKTKCFLGHPETHLDPWRLPLLLLFEADLNAKSQESELLHCLLGPLVYRIQIEANSNDALSELWAVIASFAKSAQNRKQALSWLSLVREARIVDASNQASSRVLGKSQFRSKDPAVAKAVSCMSNLKELTLLGVPWSDCTPLLNCLAQSHKATELLTKFTCTQYFFLPQLMAQFLSRQKALTKVHIEGAASVWTKETVPKRLSKAVENTKPEEMRKVIEALATAPLKVLLLEDIALGQYVSCLKPLLPRLEQFQLSLLYVEETNNCKMFFGMFSDCGEKLPLVKLYLGGNELSVAVDDFVQALKFLPDLKFLDLRHFDYKKPGKLEEQHFRVFGPALKYVPNLVHLNLQGNSIGGAAKEVGHGLQSLKELQVLEIGATDLTEESVPYLPFEQLQNIETLSIGANKFGKGVEKLAEKLKCLERLKDLEFSDANLTDESVTVLPLSSFPNLTHLDLCFNDLGSSGLCFIASQLQYIPHLEKFLLHRPLSSISDSERSNQIVGIEAIISNLYHVPKLVQLNLPVRLPSPIYHQSALLTECVDRTIFQVGFAVPLFLNAREIKNAVILVNAFNLLKAFLSWPGTKTNL